MAELILFTVLWDRIKNDLLQCTAEFT